jgi:ribosomal protein S28E/S33
MEFQRKTVMVCEIIGRTGFRSAITQVRIQFTDNKDHTLIRNVMGSVKVGDILVLLE